MSLLDEIVFQPAAMQPISACESAMSTLVSFGPHGSLRPLQAQAPWMVCHTTPEQAGTKWVDLCSRLNARGLLIECSVPALEKVPVNTIPRRLFRQSIHLPIDVENVHSADLIEITCQSPITSIWGWPPEIESSSNLPAWLNSVRQVIGGQTPLGIGVSDGVDDNAIRAILACKVDFITLHSRGNIEFLVNTLVRIRKAIEASSISTSVCVRTKISSMEQLLKVVALGANAITVDGLLSEIWQSSNSSMSSFLGTRLPAGIAAPAAPCPIAEKLDKLQTSLQQTLQLTGCSSVQALRGSLRAVSPSAAQLACLPLIGMDS
ncbi:MAG: hypothetical protein U0930_05920 [Pirellulales bacterium]